jgi:hypothetical protein
MYSVKIKRSKIQHFQHFQHHPYRRCVCKELFIGYYARTNPGCFKSGYNQKTVRIYHFDQTQQGVLGERYSVLEEYVRYLCVFCKTQQRFLGEINTWNTYGILGERERRGDSGV